LDSWTVGQLDSWAVGQLDSWTVGQMDSWTVADKSALIRCNLPRILGVPVIRVLLKKVIFLPMIIYQFNNLTI